MEVDNRPSVRRRLTETFWAGRAHLGVLERSESRSDASSPIPDRWDIHRGPYTSRLSEQTSHIDCYLLPLLHQSAHPRCIRMDSFLRILVTCNVVLIAS